MSTVKVDSGHLQHVLVIEINVSKAATGRADWRLCAKSVVGRRRQMSQIPYWWFNEGVSELGVVWEVWRFPLQSPMGFVG